MSEVLDKNIRISTRVKYALDEMRGTKSCNELIEQMINYFEVTGYNPRRPNIDSIQKIGRRIEDLIKIVRSQEKDIFRPLLDKSFSSGNMSMNNEQLVRLANENKSLKEELQRYKQSGEFPEEYKKKLESLINLIDVFCDKRQFRRAAFGDDLQVPESYFDKLLDKVKSEYVL